MSKEVMHLTCACTSHKRCPLTRLSSWIWPDIVASTKILPNICWRVLLVLWSTTQALLRGCKGTFPTWGALRCSSLWKRHSYYRRISKLRWVQHFPLPRTGNVHWKQSCTAWTWKGWPDIFSDSEYGHSPRVCSEILVQIFVLNCCSCVVYRKEVHFQLSTNGQHIFAQSLNAVYNLTHFMIRTEGVTQ